MLSKIYKYIFIFAAGLAAVGCSDDFNTPQSEPVPDSPGTLTIRFSNTRESRSTESDNSETLIKDLTVALYPNTADENTLPVTVKTFTGLTDHNTKTVTMYLTEEMVDGLFNGIDGNTCKMFALANINDNLPETTSLPAEPTISQLKNLSIKSNFKTRDVQPSFVMSGEGVITYKAGETEVDPGSASGSGSLYRAAARILLNLRLPESINIGTDDSPEIWIPEQTGIQALLNNGVEQAIAYPVGQIINGNQESWKPSSDNEYYNGELGVTTSVRNISNNGSGDYPYIMGVPFYTYPNTWEEKPDETHKTTITLMVPWRRQGEQAWHTYYYQVPVTPIDLPQIVRNYSYNVNLNVGMLGSLVPEDPMELENLTYQVVNWSDENIDVNIQDYRYLVVNPNLVSVQNEAEMTVPFYSSHPVDINNISMTFQRFNFYSNGNGDVVEITVPQNKLDASESTVNGSTEKMVSYEIVTDPVTNQMSLKINHPLEIWTPVNNANQEVLLTNRNGTGDNTLANVTNSIVKFTRPTTPEEPFSSYIFNIRIQHGDNSAYYEDITITQYPAMYIEVVRNLGDRTATGSKGNVFVNNGQMGNNNYMGSVVTDLGTGGDNNNPNMYVVTVSQLNSSSEYIIGDPRAQYYQNTLSTNNNADLPIPSSNGAPAGERTNNNGMTGNNWCVSSSALYPQNGGNRTLSYYYPTLEGQDDEYKMKVAPKFRVASSYGKTQPMGRNGARRRMATYQELNCPAGRWRLPTYGELEFIISLSSTGKIPVLYSTNTYYWTAQGACLVNADGTITLNTSQTNNVYCRGVYDEWYWEQYPQYSISPNGTNYTYTLGDMPRGAQ